jgi:hypothetical protein
MHQVRPRDRADQKDTGRDKDSVAARNHLGANARMSRSVIARRCGWPPPIVRVFVCTEALWARASIQAVRLRPKISDGRAMASHRAGSRRVQL